MRIYKIIILLFTFCLFISSAVGASVTDSAVSNTNVYAGSNEYNIAPATEIDGTSTATDITSVSGRYLYTSSLTASVSGGYATYTFQNRQGATVDDAEQGTAPGITWNYGDGTTATTYNQSHKYTSVGTYTTTATLSNYLTTTDITVSTAATLAGSGVSDCVVEDTNIYAGSQVYNVTPSSYDKGGNSATSITNTANRKLHIKSLTASLSGTSATFTIQKQGSTTIDAEQGTAQSNTINYGDGTSSTVPTLTHTYAAGIYSASITMQNYVSESLTVYSLPIVVNIPTYTANTVTQQDADIVIDAGELYQSETQFVLPTNKVDLEFFADNLFVVASGNAVYTVDTTTQEIQPVSTTTGTTAQNIYLGENAAVITDIDGNTAVYQYAENTFDYLASGNNQLIASTADYAAIVIGGKLNIYDLTEPRKIGDISTSISQLAGNDFANTFAGYSGSTIYYWYIEDGTIKTGSQTITQTITGIKQIPQTPNYIITTDKNTLIISISSAGAYSLISTSDTELPLIHPQATTIGVVIGVHPPNEIYIVGADGSTAGTYQTGATLNDASITKATGLYAITGGNDQQAYVLRKDQSSTWTLAQTIKANGAISHSQISTTGGYAAIVSGVNMYLLKISQTTDTNYYLNGIIIDSTGQPFNGAFTINGEKVTSDTSGKFSYPVTPGTQYKIIVGTTTTEYTATNAALQQIAIKLQVNPFATEIEYTADYNATAQAIEMSYFDATDKTTNINWVVVNTANNTVVATYTGNTASFPVGVEDSYTNYYVKVTADREEITVSKSWSITPAGGFPVNLYGLDDTGRNIIFGFLLIVVAGLFGALHARTGAILTAFAACILRYLELITIPWIVILVAAVIAVVAAIAGGNR